MSGAQDGPRWAAWVSIGEAGKGEVLLGFFHSEPAAIRALALSWEHFLLAFGYERSVIDVAWVNRLGVKIGYEKVPAYAERWISEWDRLEIRRISTRLGLMDGMKELVFHGRVGLWGGEVEP